MYTWNYFLLRSVFPKVNATNCSFALYVCKYWFGLSVLTGFPLQTQSGLRPSPLSGLHCLIYSLIWFQLCFKGSLHLTILPLFCFFFSPLYCLTFVSPCLKDMHCPLHLRGGGGNHEVCLICRKRAGALSSQEPLSLFNMPSDSLIWKTLKTIPLGCRLAPHRGHVCTLFSTRIYLISYAPTWQLNKLGYTLFRDQVSMAWSHQFL